MLTPTFAADGHYLFQRNYQLAVTPPGATEAKIYGNAGALQAPLRIAFTVERDVTAHANKATIQLTNLSLASRQQIVKGTLFALSAGYVDNFTLIFLGRADKISNARDGGDIHTVVECKDGADVLRYAVIDQSYKKPVKLSTLLTNIVEAMQTSIGGINSNVSAGIAIAVPNKTFPRYHLTGTCLDNLNRLLKPLDLEWSVQNGRINFAPHRTPVTQTAVVLSESTGMIGIPSVNSDVITLRSLMNPRIYPGAYVDVQSQDKVLSGLYKVRKTKHTGDTFGDDWTVEIEGVPCNPKTAQPLPITSTTNYAAAETGVSEGDVE